MIKRNNLFISIFIGFLVTIFITASVDPAPTWQNDIPLEQALVLAGGETTNPREYDPATTHGSGDKLIYSGLVSFDPNLNLTPDHEKRLMDQYAKLTSFKDSLSVLKEIKNKGISTAILSNGSREMLATVVDSNGLTTYLDRVVTIEDIRLFKTVPQAYELLLKAFPVTKEEVLFVSSNAWDALAAKWFGFDVFWVNRLGHPFEEIGEQPNYEGGSLSQVLGLI